MTNQGRLLLDSPRSGIENMSLDQAILEYVDASGLPTLRLYQWSEPTLSLGYFQHVAARADHLHSRPCPLVRRSTGGGAILHDRELTYSLCVPTKDRVSRQVTNLYAVAHNAIIRSLGKLGFHLTRFADTPASQKPSRSGDDPFLCFQRRTDDDLIFSGYKIVGSAQRRGARSTLQHGSILLRSSQFAPELPGLENLTSRAIYFEELAHELSISVSELLATKFASGDISASESQRAVTIADERFGNDSWTSRRP